MRYVEATDTGKGFVTHEDRALGYMSGHPGNIYAVSDNHYEWVVRVGGVEKTLEEASAICLSAAQNAWDNNNPEDETESQKIERIGPRPETYSLPQ